MNEFSYKIREIFFLNAEVHNKTLLIGGLVWEFDKPTGRFISPGKFIILMQILNPYC